MLGGNRIGASIRLSQIPNESQVAGWPLPSTSRRAAAYQRTPGTADPYAHTRRPERTLALLLSEENEWRRRKEEVMAERDILKETETERSVLGFC